MKKSDIIIRREEFQKYYPDYKNIMDNIVKKVNDDLTFTLGECLLLEKIRDSLK